MYFKGAFFVLAGFVSQMALSSPYDDVILKDRPVLYLALGSLTKATFEPDLSGHGHRALRKPLPALKHVPMPNGDQASLFNGSSEYLEVASHPELSVTKTGIVTIEAWLRPDTLDFVQQEGDGYVHWAGKGESNAHEYALRMYSKSNSAGRPNRISAYAFNLSGGLGSGSYFQDTVSLGEWVHVAAVINTKATSSAFPTGYVRIYKNGVLRDTTPLSQFGVIPGAGNAPLRIGTRDLRSFFKGAIGKFAIYDYELSESKIRVHTRSLSR